MFQLDVVLCCLLRAAVKRTLYITSSGAHMSGEICNDGRVCGLCTHAVTLCDMRWWLCIACVMWMCDLCEHGYGLVVMGGGAEMDVPGGLVVPR